MGASNFVYINSIAPMTTAANTTAAPVFSPGGGLLGANQPLIMTDSTPGASIYTYNFATSSAGQGVLYTGPFTLPGATYIAAYATAPGLAQSIVVYEYFYQ